MLTVHTGWILPRRLGLPGAPQGLSKEDPTLVEMLKPLGYATGSSGRTTRATATNSSPQNKPFCVWHNTTRMHYRTNLSDEYNGKIGYGLYADGMMELDDDLGVVRIS